MDDLPKSSPVVVGVDGSRAARLAVLWAAEEAWMARRPLWLVHVSEHLPPAVGLSGGEDARYLLESAREAVFALRPELLVRTAEHRRRSAADGLTDLSRAAALLVLGLDQHHDRSRHGPHGPLPDRVAVHARCPVAVVPDRLRQTEPTGAPVVVEWSDAPNGHLALVEAAAAAALRQVPLSVVTVPPGLDREVAQVAEPRKAERALVNAVAAAEERHPGLVVEISRERYHAADVLVHRSARADLLVVGCHHTSRAWSARPGPVAIQVLDRSRSAVLLVGQLARRHASGSRPAASVTGAKSSALGPTGERQSPSATAATAAAAQVRTQE